MLRRSPTACGFFLKPIVFFSAFLVILSLIRIAFFMEFRTGDFGWKDFLPAFWMGVRIDAKWLATLILPAWIFWLMSAKWPKAKKWAEALGLIAGGLMVLLGFVNIEFFRFYGTTISAVIFGLFQDDTQAIIKTVLSDWPILPYVGIFLAAMAVPVILSALIPAAGSERDAAGFNWRTKGNLISAVVLTILLSLILRGSLGKFPLRFQSLSVSPHVFINQCVPNGAILFYEAMCDQSALNFKDGRDGELKALGFRNIDEVNEVLAGASPAAQPLQPAKKPDVVLAVMESMGRDQFLSHVPGKNDTLGRLANELKNAWVFTNGLTIGPGTFPALEGILFDTPYSPLSQSRYGHLPFPFSKVLPFREAGYEVVFVTGGDANWRNLRESLPRHGFDKVYGDASIHAAFPEAEIGTWGIGDEWMFKFAKRLMDERKASDKPLLLVLLSTSNHPPHEVPDGRAALPVDPDLLPQVIERDKPRSEFTKMLQTYQYASDWLGWFVGSLREEGKLSNTIVASTGDHNARFKYPPQGALHHQLGVPILFWVPEEIRKGLPQTDQTQWVTERDIFPTLSALALGRLPLPEEGRNLALPHRSFAYGYFGVGEYGVAVGKSGAVGIDPRGKLQCFRMEGDRFAVQPCTEELIREGRFSAAQRAKAGWVIRSALLH